jgi:hypothetical protein
MTDKITARAIVPAQPGWYLVLYIEAAEGYPGGLSCEPIVAWDVERCEGEYAETVRRPRDETWTSHTVLPLTVNGNAEAVANLQALKRPDGTFEMWSGGPGGNTHATEAALIEAFRTEAAAKARAEAAGRAARKAALSSPA